MRPLALALGAAAVLAVAQDEAPSHAAWQTTARVTFFALTGVMADGEWTYPGAAACSYDLPFGTSVTFLDSGETVVCADRGLLGSGSPTWVDVWAPDGWRSVAPWGLWRTVTVVPP